MEIIKSVTELAERKQCKARVPRREWALEVLKGKQTISELASLIKFHPTMISPMEEGGSRRRVEDIISGGGGTFRVEGLSDDL